MSTEYRFDEPALNVAQKIMECRATAAVDGWPDVQLKAAIQCLVIEAMKWAAPAMMVRGQLFIDGDVSDETAQRLIEEISRPDGIFIRSEVPPVLREIMEERHRQVGKGYTAEHDDEQVCDEIAAMAAYYIMPEACREWPTEETGYGDTLGKAIIPEGWPAPESPRWRRDDLIRGIAMAVAEVERLDRSETAPGGDDA